MKAALAAGVVAEEILNKVLIAAMDEVGQRYEKGDLFVPEMLIAARAMQAGLRILKPYQALTYAKAAGSITDNHDEQHGSHCPGVENCRSA